MRRALLSRGFLALTATALLYSSGASGQVSFARYRALGDSLSHGTQGGLIVDYRSQPRAWPVLLAAKMGTEFRLPLLERQNLTSGNRRQDWNSYQYCHNMACNGASTDDTYQKAATKIQWYQLGYSWSYEDVVLAPRWGQTQVSATASDNPTFVSFFLGGNEFLQSILRYGTLFEFADWVGIDIQPLGGRAPTSQETFRYYYENAIHQLYAPGRGMALGTFPTLDHIAAVLDKAELTAIIGPNPLPEGCYTSEIIMAAIIRGWLPNWTNDLLTDDRNYYTPAEFQQLNDAVIGYNNTIREIAADPNHPCAVADLESLVEQQVAPGLVHVNGWRITDKYTIANVGKPRASMYSSDGVHPSDIGHALIANSFIDAINRCYGTNIPMYSDAELTAILNNDRFADNDGNGRIEGLSSDAFYYCVNWFLGDTYTGDSGETPRNARILTLEYTNGQWGSVGTDIEGPEYFQGTQVQLTGFSVSGKRFDHWEGDVPNGFSTENPITITMDTDKRVVAVFACGQTGMIPLAGALALMLGLALYRGYRQ
jgi:lysophospholipase L1-like esterase